MGSKTMRVPPQPFTTLAVCAAVGIAAADRWPIGWAIPAAVFVIASLAALRFRHMPVFCLAVASGFFCLHTLRHHEEPAKRLAGRLSLSPRVASARGRIAAEPREFIGGSGSTFSAFPMRLESIEIGGVRSRSDATVNVLWRGVGPKYGDLIAVTGEARNLAPPRNPGEFDARERDHRLDIRSEIFVRFSSDQRVISSGHGNLLILAGQRARRWMQGALDCGLAGAPEVAGLVHSMVLGMKSETPPEIRDLFRKTGTIHVFVVSGLHVGMLALIVWQGLKVMGLGRRATALLVVPFLAFYALLTGLGPGSVRAAIMASVVLVGIAVERPAITFNSFSAAFVLTLLWDTNELFMPGFQFSFTVVFAILLIAWRIQRRWRSLGQPDEFLPRSLWSPWQIGRVAFARFAVGLASMSFAAWIGSLAFTAGYFHLLSPSALIANLIIVPLAFVILSQGVLAILAYGISAPMAAIFNNCNWLAVKALVGTVELFAAVPGGHLYVELPDGKPTPHAEIMALDLGAGAGTHIRAGGEEWLVDCGNAHNFRSVIEPYLHRRGVNRLDGLVLTHGDAAHVGGAALVDEFFRPREVVDSPFPVRSGALKSFRASREPRAVRRGDRWNLADGATIRVLYPPADTDRGRADDETLVLLLEAEGWRVVFTSDAGFYCEQWLLENEPDLRADIVVAGRPSGDLSLTPGFLHAVAPRLIVLGQDHFAEAPRDEFAIGVRVPHVLAQRETGAVRIALWPDHAEISSHLGVGNVTLDRNPKLSGQQ